jgi:hypothetical protein
MIYVEKFTLNLKNTAFKLDKLLHDTRRLTYSAIQRTLNYVKLSSMIELAEFYLQSVNLTVQCSWKICSICTYSATPLYKNYCNALLVLIPGTNWRRYFTNLIYRDSDFDNFNSDFIMSAVLSVLLIIQAECFGCT